MPQNKPNALISLLKMKCPQCRIGDMYRSKNPWKLKSTFDMPKSCPVCGQKYELEVGFYYGTGFVSYALTVAFSVFTFILWFLLIGMSTKDSRFFYWLGINVVLLILIQPWIARISRVIYLWFFVRYNGSAPEKFLSGDASEN